MGMFLLWGIWSFNMGEWDGQECRETRVYRITRQRGREPRGTADVSRAEDAVCYE